MDSEPSNTERVCEECGGEVEWESIVWDFDDGEEQVNTARSGFGGVCSSCGLIVAISLDDGRSDVEWDFSEREVESGPNRGIEFESVMLGRTVRAYVDNKVGKVDSGVFKGRIQRVEGEQLEALEGEVVWMDFVDGELLVDNQEEVVGTELRVFEEGE